MDEIDQKILRLLIKNPSKSFLSISKELNVAPLTIQKRYEKMLGKVFSNPFVIVNLSKLGYQGKALLMLNSVEKHEVGMTVKKLRQIPNVFLVAEIVGKYDVLALAAFRNLKEIKNIVKEIRAQPSVKKVVVSLTEQTDFPLRREYDPTIYLD